jgi:hypothetical protein
MSEEPYDQITSRVAATTTAHALGRDEADALLWLAKTVADASGDRRSAPLTCYLAGQILAGEVDAEVRVARIRALADELRD